MIPSEYENYHRDRIWTYYCPENTNEFIFLQIPEF